MPDWRRRAATPTPASPSSPGASSAPPAWGNSDALAAIAGQAGAPGQGAASSPYQAVRDDFVLMGGRPTVQGQVTATPVGDGLRMQAPQVNFEGTFDWLAADQDPETVFEAGMRQTVVASHREAIYRSPDGTEFTERSGIGVALRDTQPVGHNHGDQSDDTFYSGPVALSAGRSRQVYRATDYPDFTSRTTLGDARLIGFQGADNLVSTWSVQRPDGTSRFDLGSFAWSVPWDMNLDPSSQTGNGQPVQVSEAPSHVDARRPGLAIAAITDSESLHFESPQAALASGLTLDELLAAYFRSRSRDETSAQNLLAAIRLRQPMVRVTVSVNRTDSTFGADEVVIRIGGTSWYATGEQSKSNGEQAVATCPLESVLALESLSASSALEIQAQDRGLVSSVQHTARWNMPFAPLQSTPMPGGEGGQYMVAAELLAGR